MQIKPDEITSILKQRIEGMDDGGADLSEVGTVLSIADGIARRDHHRIMVPPDARPLVRVLAAAFDQYLGRGEARHSRAVHSKRRDGSRVDEGGTQCATCWRWCRPAPP